METPKEEPKAIQKFQEATMEVVLKKVNQFREIGAIHLPKDYSVENAMRGAWLALQEMTDKSNLPVLQTCNRDSIANALLDMATQGLSVSKHQGAFIQYGKNIQFQREFAGNIALAKRYSGMKDIRANVVYKDDQFEFGVTAETGRKHIIRHEQKMSNVDFAKIIGAYALVIMEDDSTYLEVMTMDQIQKAWEQGPTKGQSPAHKNFKDQMCLKTVINRAVKVLIAASDDSVLMENVETNRKLDQANAEIKENANKGEVIDIVDDPIQTPEVIEPEPQQEAQPDTKVKTDKRTREWKQGDAPTGKGPEPGF